MKTKSFEESLEKSREILDKLMDPEVTLEKSVELYEEGVKEIKSAQKMIEEAKIKVHTIDNNDKKATD